MLDICLGILAVLGIVLLVLAALAAASLLLVLFFPLTYRVRGFREPEAFGLTVNVRWLLGLVRAVCRYPDPGRLKVKVLCFSLYDQGLDFGEEEKAGSGRKRKKKKEKSGKGKGAAGKKSGKETGEKDGGRTGSGGAGDDERQEPCVTGDNRGEKKDGSAGRDAKETDGCGCGPADAGETPCGEEMRQGPLWKLRAKLQKIKYTFWTLYDKIKKIWENISYYVNLLQEEETKLLISESLTALGKMLKSIRPRRVRANIRFGTGAPDTTGYAYGLCCMVAAAWRPGFWVTPDFEKKVLEGEFDVSGRITIWVLLVNGLKMYKLIRRMKAERKLSA